MTKLRQKNCGRGSVWGVVFGLGLIFPALVAAACGEGYVEESRVFEQVAVGQAHTCAISEGQVYCWGFNGNGQLGDGSNTSSLVPVAVDVNGVLSGKEVTQITAGGTHTCALADGQVYCWGYNYYGQLGDGSTTNSTVPVAVETNGELNGKEVTQISAGDNHTCALTDGHAYCWGDNSFGQLGDNSTTRSSIPVAVDIGGVLGGKEVTQISAGFFHTCALAEGQVYCWGDNNNGQLGDDSTNESHVPVAVDTSVALNGKEVTQVGVGNEHTCALAEGRVYCWGSNSYGQLGDNSNDERHVPVAVDTGGVLGGKAVTQISEGGDHVCALADEQVFCWGRNYYGQLGDNSNTNRWVPVAVDTSGVLGGKVVTQIDTALHTCALAEGQVFCWGNNSAGQLGDTSTTNRPVPVAVFTDDITICRPLPPTPPANNSNSSSSNNRAHGATTPPVVPTCTVNVPVGTPDLFQIDRRGNEATLWFTPVKDYTKQYHVVFGHQAGQEQYGGIALDVSDEQNSGVQTLTIRDLNPSQPYSFQVLPVAGCAVGERSNWLTVKPVNNNATVKTYRHAGE